MLVYTVDSTLHEDGNIADTPVERKLAVDTQNTFDNQ